MSETNLRDLFSKMFESKTISPNYKIPHIIHTLLLLGQDDYGIGRYRIRKEIHLGEGSIKTMLSRLREEKLIDVLTHRQQGHILTATGKAYLQQILSFMSSPEEIQNPENKYVIGTTAFYSVVFHQKLKPQITLGIPQRDEAIKIGANGASTLVFTGEQLIFPNSKAYSTEIAEIDLNRLEKGDIVIIGGGNSSSIAILGVIAAVISIIDLK